jgi:hypothetical protein
MLMMTKSSADATGLPFSRATPGASLITRASSRARLLDNSLAAPSRKTMATSVRPADVTALRKPAAMDRTPTNTITTPAMPNAAETEAPLRCGIVRNPSQVTDAIWESQLIMDFVSAFAPQRFCRP